MCLCFDVVVQTLLFCCLEIASHKEMPSFVLMTSRIIVIVDRGLLFLLYYSVPSELGQDSLILTSRSITKSLILSTARSPCQEKIEKSVSLFILIKATAGGTCQKSRSN